MDRLADPSREVRDLACRRTASVSSPVVDADGTLAYRGPIDVEVRGGGRRALLAEALEATLAGRPVALAGVPVPG